MHPILFHFGDIPVYTYGAMIALGFIAGVILNGWLATKVNLSAEKIIDYSLWGMAVGLLGARLIFLVTILPQVLADPGSAFRVWEGGFVFWGGPLAVVLFSLWYLKKFKIPFWNAADVVTHGLVIGHIIGRFGCIGAGCCYGRPTGSDWGFKFHGGLVPASLHGIALHPTQLYESISLMFLLAVLLWVFFHRKFEGQVVLTYFLGYPIIRSIIEIYRGDQIRGFVIDGRVSTSQFISALVFVVAFFVLKKRLNEVNRGRVPTHAS